MDCSRPPRSWRASTSSARRGRTGALTPDPDPIDFDGHGSHVADIIGGASSDGQHKGVAPGVKFHSVKVCSSISTACSGVAMLQGLDYALDPNGDGDTSDAVDLVNMSIGSPYGQKEDDTAEASANVVSLGVMVVASAGNSANRPYVTGAPAMARGVLSVAQTEVPSALAVALVVNAPPAIAGTYDNTQTVDWARVGDGVTGDVASVGRGCPADAVAGTPEDPYLVSPAGKIALIQRGVCSVSLKVDRAAKAGATGVIIGLVAPGDAVSFSFGGGDTFVPTIVIQQVLNNAIRAQIAGGQTVNVSYSEAVGVPLVQGVVSSSSRGPAFGYPADQARDWRAGRVGVGRGGHGNGRDRVWRHLRCGADGDGCSCTPDPGASESQHQPAQGHVDEQRRDGDLHQQGAAAGPARADLARGRGRAAGRPRHWPHGRGMEP